MANETRIIRGWVYSPDGICVGQCADAQPPRRKMTEEERLMKSALNDILPEMVTVLDKHEQLRDAEHIKKALDDREAELIAISNAIRKAEEDEVVREYEASEVKLGEDPADLTPERYNRYEQQRQQRQQFEDIMRRLSRK